MADNYLDVKHNERFFEISLDTAGVILVGIFKEVNKNSKAKKAKAKHPVPPMPSPVEVNPMPFPYPKHGAPQIPGRTAPADSSRTTGFQTIFQTANFETKKEKRRSIRGCISCKHLPQDERNSRQGAHYNTPHDSPDNKEDFTIHSAEEARRAIIWGEILQRKY